MTDINRDAIIAKRIEDSTTSVTKTVFPGRTNHHNTLFGGDALAWMDEVAFIAATRFCRKPLVIELILKRLFQRVLLLS